MRVLNLYACLGGNRYKWGNEHEITAVELDPELARMYKERFPNDTVIVADAHPILLLKPENEVNFYAPKICIDYLQDYHKRMTLSNFENLTVIRYRGFRIIQTYLPEVTLAHRDYALFLSEELISKVPL